MSTPLPFGVLCPLGPLQALPSGYVRCGRLRIFREGVAPARFQWERHLGQRQPLLSGLLLGPSLP